MFKEVSQLLMMAALPEPSADHRGKTGAALLCNRRVLIERNGSIRDTAWGARQGIFSHGEPGPAPGVECSVATRTGRAPRLRRMSTSAPISLLGRGQYFCARSFEAFISAVFHLRCRPEQASNTNAFLPG